MISDFVASHYKPQEDCGIRYLEYNTSSLQEYQSKFVQRYNIRLGAKVGGTDHRHIFSFFHAHIWLRSWYWKHFKKT